MTLPAKLESLSVLTEFARKGANEANLPEVHMRQLELLVEEILVNISRYAYPEGASGTVVFSYSVPRPGEIEIEVSDQGAEFDPLAMAPPDLTLDLAQRKVGGLGILLLKSLALSPTYLRQQGWNRLRFGISTSQ